MINGVKISDVIGDYTFYVYKGVESVMPTAEFEKASQEDFDNKLESDVVFRNEIMSKIKKANDKYKSLSAEDKRIYNNSVKAIGERWQDETVSNNG